MSAAGAVLVLEGLEPAGWVVEVLPGLVSIPVVQGALVVTMLGLVAVMAVRWTVGVVAAAAVITVLGGWLVLAPVFTRFDGPWVVALGALLVMAAATAAVSGSERPSSPFRRSRYGRCVLRRVPSRRLHRDDLRNGGSDLRRRRAWSGRRTPVAYGWGAGRVRRLCRRADAAAPARRRPATSESDGDLLTHAQ